MNHETIRSALDWRYATKSFDSTKKIASEDWSLLQESLVKSPSSYGLQPWRFLVIQNPKVREELKAVSWGQTQVTDCSHYVVFLYKEKMDEAHIQKHINRVAEVRGVPLTALEGYKKMMVQNLTQGPRAQTIDSWAQRQTYIAMGFLMETAALLKIDACPIEGFEPLEYDRILKLEGTGWRAVATVALGYRSEKDSMAQAKKVRFEPRDLISVID